jgi:hypothetical protein
MVQLLNDSLFSRAQRYDVEDGCAHYAQNRIAVREVANGILSGLIQVENIDSRRLFGVETETSCLGSLGHPFTQEMRDTLVDARQHRDKELGATQIELQSLPVDIGSPTGFGTLWENMVFDDTSLNEDLSSLGAVAVRLGADPIIPIDEAMRSKGIPRYHIVPDFHARFRQTSYGGIWDLPPYVVGALSSVQFNLDCFTIEEAVDLLNRSFVTSAYVLALAANARYLDGADTGYADVRNILWERTHEIRTEPERNEGLGGRIGLPTGFYGSLYDYFCDVHDQPTILPAEIFEGENSAEPFNIATRLLWRDARLKFLPTGTSARKIVLEFRPMSVQPTVCGDYAMVLFGLGHMFGSRIGHVPLPAFSNIRANREFAMCGKERTMWYHNASGWVIGSREDVLARECARAADGLRSLECPESCIGSLEEEWNKRIKDGPPADTMTRDLAVYASLRATPVNRSLLHSYLLDTHMRHQGTGAIL